jgi:hypothetical protein
MRIFLSPNWLAMGWVTRVKVSVAVTTSNPSLWRTHFSTQWMPAQKFPGVKLTTRFNLPLW